MPIKEYQMAEAMGDTTKNSAQTISLMSFIACLCLGYGLKYIWNIINVLQFTIFMLRWDITLPMLTKSCLSSLKMLVLFEFIPTVSIVE